VYFLLQGNESVLGIDFGHREIVNTGFVFDKSTGIKLDTIDRMERGSWWHEQILFSGVLGCMCRQSRVSAVSQAVAVTADGDGGGVMEESIQQCGGQDGIGEEVAPCGIGFAGSEDDGFALVVAFGDDLEEEGGVVLFKGEVTDFVEEEQVGTCERVLEDMESVSLFCDTRFCDEVMKGDEVDAMAGLQGFEREAHGQVGLAHAGRA